MTNTADSVLTSGHPRDGVAGRQYRRNHPRRGFASLNACAAGACRKRKSTSWWILHAICAMKRGRLSTSEFNAAFAPGANTVVAAAATGGACCAPTAKGNCLLLGWQAPSDIRKCGVVFNY